MEWTDEAVAELVRLRTAGLTFPAIARQLGCTDNAATNKSRRLAVPRGRIVKVEREVPPDTTRGRVLPSKPGVVDLVWSSCRWPIGDPQKPGFHFCGERRDGTKPYCKGHCRLAFVPVTGR